MHVFFHPERSNQKFTNPFFFNSIEGVSVGRIQVPKTRCAIALFKKKMAQLHYCFNLDLNFSSKTVAY